MFVNNSQKQFFLILFFLYFSSYIFLFTLSSFVLIIVIIVLMSAMFHHDVVLHIKYSIKIYLMCARFVTSHSYYPTSCDVLVFVLLTTIIRFVKKMTLTNQQHIADI